MSQNQQALPYSITGIHSYPWIRWWYTIAAPPAPSQIEGLALKEREFLRRGKLTSIALLIELVLLLIELNAALRDGTKIYIFILINISFLIIATVLNRFRKLLLASLLTIFTVEVGMVTAMMSPVGGLMGVASIPFLFLLVQPLMISVLLFPSWTILLIGAINVLVTCAALLFVPKTAELQSYMLTPIAFQIVFTPIVTLTVCALISFIVITSLQESLVRADKAEEISKLQQTMAEQTRRELQTKYQLEKGIREIVSGLTRFGNGDLHARVQLEQGHPLWSVASSLNNVLGRFARLREQEKPMEQTYMALQSYLAAIRMSKVTGTPMMLPQTGTEIDILVKEVLTSSSFRAQQSKQESWDS
jgi:hypothetical protein